MIRLVPVTVECYSGYKADEYPKSFALDEKKYEIRDIIDRWYQGDLNPEWPASNYFRVETTCGEKFILKHDLESDEWHLCA